MANDGNDQRKRARSIHLRRLDDYATRIVERAAAQRLTPADLRADLAKLPWYDIRNAADEDAAVVFVYDEIGGTFGVSAEQFARDLEDVDASTIEVRINSPGGSLYDSVAIYNTLRAHPARVVAIVDSLAASGASLIAMAADEVIMRPASQMMIHDAIGVEMGNAADMARMSTFLDRQSANISTIYAARAGGRPEDWRAMMLEETWFWAQEAVEAGLADRVEDRPLPDEGPDDDLDAELRALMRRTFHVADRYRFASRIEAPPPRARRTTSPPTTPPAPAPTNAAPADGIDLDQIRSALEEAFA